MRSLIRNARMFAGYYKVRMLRRFIPNYRRSVDFSTEIDHWRNVLLHFEKLSPEVKADFLNRMDPNRLLQEPLATLIQSLPQPWRILDVGCGPLSTIGLRLGERKIALVGADPLADVYRSLLSEAGIPPNCELVQTDCLDLEQRFSEQPFSITTSINALDHASNPLQVIQQMAKATSPNGYVFLHHVENEGLRERYSGLHQWNFSVRRGAPTLSDGATFTSLEESLPELRLVESRREEKMGAHFLMFLFKKLDSSTRLDP